MDFRYYSDMNVMHIRNFFTTEEYVTMWNELSALCIDEFLIDAKEAGGATTENVMLRDNRGLPIESIMEAENSSIIQLMNKVNCADIISKLTEYDELFNAMYDSRKQTHLINHYTNSQSYGYHKDNCVITAICVFHKTPMTYTGGKLSFRDSKGYLEPTLLTKDLIIFPSNLEHAVSSVNLIEGVSMDNMNGRISVSKFIK